MGVLARQSGGIILGWGDRGYPTGDHPTSHHRHPLVICHPQPTVAGAGEAGWKEKNNIKTWDLLSVEEIPGTVHKHLVVLFASTDVSPWRLLMVIGRKKRLACDIENIQSTCKPQKSPGEKRSYTPTE